MLDKNNFHDEAILTLTLINITYSPLPHKYPKEVMSFMEYIYTIGLSKSNLYQSIKDLNRFIDKYPTIPVLYNYLSVAYQSCGNYKQSGVVIKKCYDLFPDYIFGVCNYARFLFFKDGNPEIIPQIFKNKFNINDAFPKRKEYHISEVEQFYVLQAYYWAAKNNTEAAEKFLAFLEKICAKDSPYISLLRTYIKKRKKHLKKYVFLKTIRNKIGNLLRI